MTRKELHDGLDDLLNEWGYDEEIPYHWGEISMRIIFQAGKITLKIRERETEKDVTAS